MQSLQVGVSAAAAAEKRYGAFFFSCFLFACFYSVEKTGRTSAAAAACKYLVAKCGGGGGGGRQNANVLLSGFCTGLPSSLPQVYIQRERARRHSMRTTVVFRSVVVDSFGSKDIGAVFRYSRGPERCALPRSFPHKQLNLSMSRLKIRWAMFD